MSGAARDAAVENRSAESAVVMFFMRVRRPHGRGDVPGGKKMQDVKQNSGCQNVIGKRALDFLSCGTFYFARPL